MRDKREDYLDFLADHQPMPSDYEISVAEGEYFAAALKYFEAHIDDRCVPLFINAVSAQTGLGMYEHIKFVLMGQRKSVVVEHLKAALKSANPHIVFRACWWAVDVQAAELTEQIRELVKHDDEDVRFAATSFMEWHTNM